MNEVQNMSEKLERFTRLMKSIFELDKSDLDFGIYRIMNIRRAEIGNFLDERLPAMVQEVLAPFASNTENIEKRIAEIEKTCEDVGVDVAHSKMAGEYASLKSQLTSGVDLSALETDVYSALYSFFNRYYDEGDFISKRRYKEGVYAIPYEGEEVKLYWANQDQYYIKTTENFRDYTFKADDWTVHFLLVNATTEQNNNKESNENKRTFMLYTGNDEHPEIKTFEYREETHEFIVRFVFDVPEDKKIKHADQNAVTIRQKIVADYPALMTVLLRNISSDPKKPKYLIDKHLEAYVAKNTFDYFIHKDLKGFLTRELDFYIKSEIIHLDDIDTSNEKRVGTYLAKVKAIKRVGKIIIDFLAQIENFQKKLWLKKKFVVNTDWCITLDKIDESFYEEIRHNKAQVQEWIDLYVIDEVDGWTNPPSMDFLHQNWNLIVDTKHFPSIFKERLLATIDNLDEQTDGILIQGDNFHALNLLLNKYRLSVKCVYIDPPYNADASEILYKNGFKHSSWLSMMDNRLCLAYELMQNDGMICLTIDDCERDNASILFQQVFGTDNLQGVVSIRNNPQGRSTVKGFAINHEYALFSSKSDQLKSVGRLKHSQKQKERYSEVDKNGEAFLWENFRKTGTDSNHADRPKQFYPIYVNSAKGTFRLPALEWNTSSNSWVILEQLHPDEVSILPIAGTGEEKVWKWGIDRVQEYPDHIKVEAKGDDIQFYRRNYFNDEGSLPNTWWDKPQYAAGSHGTNLLTSIFGANRKFLFPKSVYAEMDCITVCSAKPNEIVLDFFAGSATTGHAVVKLNREDNGRRKYILVEMGEYFNTVTKPRMKKICYSDDWRAGKPLSRNEGISQIIKYFSLESYEDALSNISMSDKGHELLGLLGDDYLIHYMLDVESKESLLDIDQIKAPFNYKLKITEHNETKEKVIDLAETFNYLLGLTVVCQSAITYYKATPDMNGGYEGAVVLTEDMDGEYAFKQIEGTLPDGRRALVIWRAITDDLIASNATLDAYFAKNRRCADDRAYDVVYVNGDSNLANLKKDNERWKVYLTEIEFKQLMFEEN